MRTLSRLVTGLLALALVAGPAVPAGAAADPLRDEQWALEQVRAPGAWSWSRGVGQTIAVIDSGVDLDHPDLDVVGGTTFLGCAGQPDGCGDGDWRDKESGPGDDPSVHGTHVAGLAAAVGGNGTGIAGVAPDASLLAVKALRRDEAGRVSGNADDIAAGIRWAVRNGADVINLSLASLPGTQALTLTGDAQAFVRAAREAVDAGVVVVAAAGNEAASVCGEPAFDPSVLCTVATDRQEQPAWYSNRAGDGELNVVAAPGGAGLLVCGEDVLSTFPAGLVGPCERPAGYGMRSGTSMAAPHVAGVAALLLAQGRSAEETLDLLRTTARQPGTGVRGVYTATHGWGIVDATRAVATDPPGDGDGDGDQRTVVERHAGEDRVATAAAVSERTFDTAGTVVLARAGEYADALAGAPLATHLDAPLLLTGRDELSAAASAEIDRLGASAAVLLGGTAALSEQVRRDLESRHGMAREDVRRVAGESRFATAAAVADELRPFGEVLVTEGAHPDPKRGWPDALSASALAGVEGIPILLVTHDELPEATRGALDADTDVTVVGGPAAVSRDVEERLDDEAGAVTRLAGQDRYATSAAALAEAERRGARPSTFWVATGRDYPDGLAAGAAAAAVGGVFALVDGEDLRGSPATRDAVGERSDEIHSALVAGGVEAVTQHAENQLRELVR